MTVNAAPTISGPTNVVMKEDGTAGGIPFTLGDAETAQRYWNELPDVDRLRHLAAMPPAAAGLGLPPRASHLQLVQPAASAAA